MRAPACNNLSVAGWVMGFLLLAGCGALTPDKLPALKLPEQAAELTIIRQGALLYSGNAANITVDGWIGGHLFNRQYLTIPLDPGLHSVGLTSSTTTLVFGPGEKVYFRVVVFPHSMAIRRIAEEEARKLMAQCRQIQGP